FKIGPPDINARFIAPFVANKSDINEWLAGGNSLWVQNKGFAIRKRSEWTKVYSFDTTGARVATALAMNGAHAIAAWCGPGNNNGFSRGVAIGTKSGGKWSFAPATLTGVPTRFIGGVAISPDGNTFYLGLNGFSRRFTEGEGAGIGHLFQSTD